MTTSNAKIITEKREITLTTRTARTRRNSLAAQKLAGMVMLAFSVLGIIIGGNFSAALIVAPLALAAVFSKEKILDFAIFAKVPENNPKGTFRF